MGESASFTGFSLSSLSLLFFTRCVLTFKQPGGTVTQQAFRSIAQVLNDISGGLLPGHQSYRFACIDIGELVVLAGDRLCKLLTRFVGLWERINMGMPLIGKAIAQGLDRGTAEARLVLVRRRTHG